MPASASSGITGFNFLLICCRNGFEPGRKFAARNAVIYRMIKIISQIPANTPIV